MPSDRAEALEKEQGIAARFRAWRMDRAKLRLADHVHDHYEPIFTERLRGRPRPSEARHIEQRRGNLERRVEKLGGPNDA